MKSDRADNMVLRNAGISGRDMSSAYSLKGADGVYLQFLAGEDGWKRILPQVPNTLLEKPQSNSPHTLASSNARRQTLVSVASLRDRQGGGQR